MGRFKQASSDVGVHEDHVTGPYISSLSENFLQL